VPGRREHPWQAERRPGIQGTRLLLLVIEQFDVTREQIEAVLDS
jgi:hypothetical protein